MMTSSTEQLAALIDQKCTCLTQIRDLGQHQLELSQSGNMDLLMKLLSTKQRLLDHMLRIEKQLEPFRDQDPDQRPWPTPQDRQRCAVVAQRCELLLQAIVEQEKQSETALVRRRDQAEKRLQGTHVAGLVHHAYVQDAGAGRIPQGSLPQSGLPPTTPNESAFQAES